MRRWSTSKGQRSHTAPQQITKGSVTTFGHGSVLASNIQMGIIAAGSKKRLSFDLQDIFVSVKQSMRDGMRQEIYDLLYDDRTGLQASKYDDETLAEKTDTIFQHFMH